MSVKTWDSPLEFGGSEAEGSWQQAGEKLGHIRLTGAALRRIFSGWPGWTLLGLLPVVVGAVYQATAAANEIRKYTAPGRLVDVGGRRLHLRTLGEGRPTVILEATGFGCSVDYASIQAQIARTARVVAYDRAGMGWSDPQEGPRSVQALLEDLRALLQRAEIAPPYLLVAGSAGGLIVELFARKHPEEVLGLVLIDALDGEALARLPRASAHLMKMVSLGQICARVGILSLLDPFGLKNLSVEEGGIRSALTYRAAAWDAARFFLKTLQQSEADLRSAPPLRADLPVTVLTHGIVGDLLGPRAHPKLLREIEPIWQAQQSALAQRSSRGRQVIAEKSGHRIIAQQPELVVEAVREILSRVREE